MSAFHSSRGRVLSGQQVRVSSAPVTLAPMSVAPQHHHNMNPQNSIAQNGAGSATIRMESDPVTGEITEIHIECSCGELIVLECHYEDRK